MVRRSAYIALGGLNLAAFPAAGPALLDLARRASGEGWRLALAATGYVFRPPMVTQDHASKSLEKEDPALAPRYPGTDLQNLFRLCRELPDLSALRAAPQLSLNARQTLGLGPEPAVSKPEGES
jgi:hypothetical protein